MSFSLQRTRLSGCKIHNTYFRGLWEIPVLKILWLRSVPSVVGQIKRYWMQSLCLAIVRAKGPADDRKVDAGIDFMDVSPPSTNWVVT